MHKRKQFKWYMYVVRTLVIHLWMFSFFTIIYILDLVFNHLLFSAQTHMHIYGKRSVCVCIILSIDCNDFSNTCSVPLLHLIMAVLFLFIQNIFTQTLTLYVYVYVLHFVYFCYLQIITYTKMAMNVEYFVQ